MDVPGLGMNDRLAKLYEEIRHKAPGEDQTDHSDHNCSQRHCRTRLLPLDVPKSESSDHGINQFVPGGQAFLLMSGVVISDCPCEHPVKTSRALQADAHD